MTQMLIVFATVFLAELGDKTQIATVLFATDSQTSPWLVFLAASAALVASTGVAVAFGVAAEAWLNRLPLKLMAGIGFILIGLWTLYNHFQSA